MEQSNKIRLILAGTGHFSSQIFESLILNKFNKTSKSFFLMSICQIAFYPIDAAFNYP